MKQVRIELVKAIAPLNATFRQADRFPGARNRDTADTEQAIEKRLCHWCKLIKWHGRPARESRARCVIIKRAGYGRLFETNTPAGVICLIAAI